MIDTTDPKGSSEPDRAAEIEITAEMVEAGVSAFCAHDNRFSSDEELVCSIYKAMSGATLGRLPASFSLKRSVK